MDALWNLEEKLKVSTEEAIVLLSCTAFLVIGICSAVFLRKYWSKKRKRSLIHQEPTTTRCRDQLEAAPEQNSWAGGVKKVLMSSVRWSGLKVKKWEKEGITMPPLLLSARFEGDCLGCWESQNNSSSPVWKRPILMGEKCELPRFSGLILYDERGRPVHHNCDPRTVNYQVRPIF